MKKFFFILVALVIALISADRAELLSPIKNAAARATSPLIQTSFRGAQAVRIFAGQIFISPNALRAENERLRAQFIEYEKNKSEALLLKEENESLRNLLNYASSTPNIISARVIGIGTDNMMQKIIIDRGATDGIQTGDTVVAEQGILIGTIWNTKEHESFVELITDNQSKIGASILNMKRTIGIASGSHSLSVQIEMIPQDEVLKIGDWAVTSGIEKSIPKGLLIGQIASVKKESFEPFQTARLALPIEFNKLAWVGVITR